VPVVNIPDMYLNRARISLINQIRNSASWLHGKTHIFHSFTRSKTTLYQMLPVCCHYVCHWYNICNGGATRRRFVS